jgi:hypothetical protein
LYYGTPPAGGPFSPEPPYRNGVYVQSTTPYHVWGINCIDGPNGAEWVWTDYGVGG